MATTTNYGWDTPDDTDLVKDGAAAIRTLGSSIDTTTKALNPSTTEGDLEYRSATANTNTRLGIGTTGQVLTVAGGVPTWAAVAAGGKVLQVVYGSTTTEFATTSTSYGDTGLTASITPSATSSKILVIVSQHIYANKTSGASGAAVRLLRGATSLIESSRFAYIAVGGNNTELMVAGSMTYLDSPSTTSSTTYKTQGAISFSGTNASFQWGTNPSEITLIEIGA